MKALIAVALVTAMPNVAHPEEASGTYWFALSADQPRWCGYSDEKTFKADAEAKKPTESARVVFLSGKLTELTYQVQPESGDWIVVDKYTPSSNGMILRRANLLAQENLQIIQRSVITGSTASPLTVEKITTLDGKKVSTNKIDYPEVPIRLAPTKFPFMNLVKSLSRFSKICEK